MASNRTLHFELAARWYVFFMLTAYGLGKLGGGQFYRRGHLPANIARQTLSDVGSFDLAWTFMGHSWAYVAFVGVLQLMGAAMLLWPRTKLLGVAILIPILLNIIVFDIIFAIPTGALASACLYFVLLIFISYANRDKLIAIIETMLSCLPAGRSSRSGRLKTVGVVVLIIVGIRLVEQFMMNYVGQ